MAPEPLPDELGDAFSVGTARSAGVSWSRLRAGDLDRPFRGVRVRTSRKNTQKNLRDGEAATHELRDRALVFALAMPANQFFTHVTAAVLWGLPLPLSVLRDSFGRLRSLDVGVFRPLRHPRHAGVIGHQVKPRLAEVVVHEEHGVRLTAPASTWAMLGSLIRDEYDLVAVADAAVREILFQHDPNPIATTDELKAAVRAGRRLGAPAIRLALDRVRTRSASRMETRCRLILIDGGMPEPELNFTIRDRDGNVVACVDLAYPEHRIAIEYEGEQHLLDPDLWAKDIARYETLAEMGWFVIRVTKAQVFGERSMLVSRVRRALRARAAA